MSELPDVVMKIIKYYKDEMVKKLEVALEPFKEEIPNPLKINIVIGDL